MTSDLDASAGSLPGTWRPDPWERHQHRWHDGEAWTAHVIDDGVQAHDPPGAAAQPLLPRLPPALPSAPISVEQRVAAPLWTAQSPGSASPPPRGRLARRLVKLSVCGGLVAGAVVAAVRFVPADDGEQRLSDADAVAAEATLAAVSPVPSSTPAAAPAQDAASPLELLPPSGTIADVLGVIPTAREAELSERLTQSVQQHPDWWAAHVASAGGGPIAYHPNLGLTEAEFTEFMAYAQNPNIGVISQVTISSTTTAAGDLEIAWTSPSEQGAVVIDADTGAFVLPTGGAIAPVPWSNTELDSFLGAAHGWEWTWTDPSVAEDVTTGSGAAVTARVGVRDSDGRVFLGVQTGMFDNGTPTAHMRIDMLYDRP